MRPFTWNGPYGLFGLGLVVLLFVLGLLTTPSLAQTADGMTPAEETVCDGQSGALWGLCVAYCEAMDCDSPFPFADEEACERVLANYMIKAGGEMPPCSVDMDDDQGGMDDTGSAGEEGGAGDGSGVDGEGGNTDQGGSSSSGELA